MPMINNAGPKIIGAKPNLNEDQRAVVELLKEAMVQAQNGNITSIAIIACMGKGYAHVMAGRQAADLNMGCDSLKFEILERVEKVGAQNGIEDQAMRDFLMGIFVVLTPSLLCVGWLVWMADKR